MTTWLKRLSELHATILRKHYIKIAPIAHKNDERKREKEVNDFDKLSVLIYCLCEMKSQQKNIT